MFATWKVTMRPPKVVCRLCSAAKAQASVTSMLSGASACTTETRGSSRSMLSGASSAGRSITPTAQHQPPHLAPYVQPVQHVVHPPVYQSVATNVLPSVVAIKAVSDLVKKALQEHNLMAIGAAGDLVKKALEGQHSIVLDRVGDVVKKALENQQSIAVDVVSDLVNKALERQHSSRSDALLEMAHARDRALLAALTQQLSSVATARASSACNAYHMSIMLVCCA